MVAICLGFVVSAIIVGGGLGYLSADLFGHQTIPCYIGATVAAFLSVCLSMPGGIIGFVLFHPEKANLLTRSLAALVMGILILFVGSTVILPIAAFVSLGGAALYYFNDPGLAALYSAIVFPYLGVVFGLGVANPYRE